MSSLHITVYYNFLLLVHPVMFGSGGFSEENPNLLTGIFCVPVFFCSECCRGCRTIEGSVKLIWKHGINSDLHLVAIFKREKIFRVSSFSKIQNHFNISRKGLKRFTHWVDRSAVVCCVCPLLKN